MSVSSSSPRMAVSSEYWKYVVMGEELAQSFFRGCKGKDFAPRGSGVGYDS